MKITRCLLISTITKLRVFFRPVKTPSNPRHAWPKPLKPIRDLYSILSRQGKTPNFTPKNRLTNAPNSDPRSHKKNQKRFIRALAHSVNQHPQTVFLTGCRQSINRNPKGTPDLSFDDFRERRVNRIFKSDWRVVYRVSGCNPDDKNVWRYSKHTSCPDRMFGVRHRVAVIQTISCPVL